MSSFKISKQFPSPILEDFQSFIHHFLKGKIKLTASGYLPGKICFKLNEQLILSHEESKPKQRHIQYPNLYFFYVLAINGQLLEISAKGKSLYASANLDLVEQFFDLSDTEQYISIIEILWMHTDWEILSSPERPRSPAYLINHLLEKVSSGPEVDSTIIKNDLGGFTFDLWPFVRYLEYLGLWEARFEKVPGTRFRHFESCNPTSFGIEVAKILTTNRRIKFWNKWERFEPDDFSFAFLDQSLDTKEVDQEETKEEPKEKFLLAFRHLFPEGELENSFYKDTSSFKEGNHVFKVSFKYMPEIWRKISMPSKSTLHDFHHAIQRAVNFDDDHLYAFYPDNNRYSRFSYQNPFNACGASGAEIRIGELQLNIGQTFLYLFDFGDNWEFEIVLEEIDTNSAPLKKYKILQSQGKAPDQYPDYDEEDWF